LSAAAHVLRILLDAGHGLSNDKPEQFDNGATSKYGGEAAIVSRIVEKVYDHYYFSRDEACNPLTEITVQTTPVCNESCLSAHPRSSHLAYKIRWINEHALRVNKREYGDVVLSVHMNAADSEKASGTEVIVDDRAGIARYHEAQNISRIVAGVLGLPDRGAKTDIEGPRGSIAIVEDTNPPAYLVELGFVTNEGDVRAVEACGVEAVIAAIDAIVAAGDQRAIDQFAAKRRVSK
jgi:N-acetylmuramoyl-L-alanine amidase